MKLSQKHHIRALYSGAVLVVVFFLSLTPHLGQDIVSLQETIKETIIEKIEETKPKVEAPLASYAVVEDSCDFSYSGICVNVRSSPSVNAPVIFKARNGIVLKIQEAVTDKDGNKWYKLSFDEWLRYPERLSTDAYISAAYVTVTKDEGTRELTSLTVKSKTKHIIVDRSDQMLYAYDGETLFMKEKVSTGIEATPTPRGNFTIYRKTPSRYMQGPIPDISDHYYDLPGVPWNLYFTEQGAVIHGAYWHNSFGQVWSNGCVNLSPESAKKLYLWADLGVKVTVRD